MESHYWGMAGDFKYQCAELLRLVGKPSDQSAYERDLIQLGATLGAVHQHGMLRFEDRTKITVAWEVEAVFPKPAKRVKRERAISLSEVLRQAKAVYG